MCGLYAFGHIGWFGGMFMVLFWALIIGLVVWGASRMGRYGRPVHYGCSDRALEIAKERYAKGEISKGEFEQVRKDLS